MHAAKYTSTELANFYPISGTFGADGDALCSRNSQAVMITGSAKRTWIKTI